MTNKREIYLKALKRQAKALVRNTDLIHARALGAIATEQGFPHWPALMAAYDAGTFPGPELLDPDRFDPLEDIAGMTSGEVRAHLHDVFREARANYEILLAADHKNYAGPLSDEGMDVKDWFEEQFPGIDELHGDLVQELAWQLEERGPWLHRDDLIDDDGD